MGVIKWSHNWKSGSNYVQRGIQALELLKADKKTIDILKKNLKEEESFGDWLERNNPKVAKRLMTNQMEKNKKRAKKSKRQESEQAMLSASVA